MGGMMTGKPRIGEKPIEEF